MAVLICIHIICILYYNILSDSMIILYHGNIMCRHQFHDIIMHNLSDIDEIKLFDNGGPHLHKYICVFIRHHFLTMKSCVDTIFEMM